MSSVSHLALSPAQVDEKKKRENDEKNREAYYDQERNHQARLLMELENERLAEAKKRELELQRFREQQAQEAFLRKNAEDQRLKQAIGRDHALFNLEGSDTGSLTRARAQVAQQQDWLNAQIDNKISREEAERAEQLAYEQAQHEIAVKLERLTQLKAEQVAAERARLRDFHLAQQEEMRLRREWEKQQDDRLAQQDIEHQLNSALLNELTQVRRDNANRPIPAEFKGFDQTQRQAILDEQQRQIEELKVRRERERAEEQAWQDRMENDRRTLVLLQREKERNHKQSLLSLQREREAQSFENTTRSEHLNKVVYTNKVDDSFFDKFGKSCR
jgi:hypothetical protein